MVDPRCAPIDGIVSWWHADDDYDDAIGSNDGLTAGAVTVRPGVDHEGFSFNGNDGLVRRGPQRSASLQMTTGDHDRRVDQPAGAGRPHRRQDHAVRNDGYLLDIIGDTCA